ncbi:MAG: pyroglutamyl-peptidase I [Burkholderiales bacterium]|nr:pyroglutamyl-peptidase I [Burkholderiales bacterium]
MKKILLTGFDPFDHEVTNPSWEAVRTFDGKVLQKPDDPAQHYLIVSAQLPCEFYVATEKLNALLAAHQPEIVICVGQAGGRADISVERIAINIDDARIPDNAGNQPIDEAVVKDGPAAYFSSLPIKAIVHNLRQQGMPANVSQTAGTYVCNHIFYGLMHYANTHASPKRAGFIHIPYLPEQAAHHPGAPSMALHNLIFSLESAVLTCLQEKLDYKESMGTEC